MRVGFLGPEGTFSHDALMRAGRPGLEPVPQPTLHDAVLAVQEAVVDLALVPFENAIEGAVNPVLDALVFEAPDVRIVGELVHPVRHCLIAADGTSLDAVRRVVSHPQASAQCARFLREHLAGVPLVAAPSTADAVRLVAASDEPDAALGPRAAAELYGCAVLREGVEDDPDNVTRFVWLALQELEPPNHALDALDHGLEPPDHALEGPGHELAGPPKTAVEGPGYQLTGLPKTALVFWGAGSAGPGWLVACLSEFAARSVNLTRIESRPLRRGLGQYLFLLELEGGEADSTVAGAIAGLRAHADVVRVLGSFPAA
jgi:prephenate dehydratase